MYCTWLFISQFLFHDINMLSGVLNRSPFSCFCKSTPKSELILFSICACRMKKLQFRSGRKKVMLVNLGEFIIHTRIS